MTCDEACEGLTHLIDGELDGKSASKVKAHIAECAACTRAEAELRMLREVARLPDGEIAPDLWPQVSAELSFAAGLETVELVRAMRVELHLLREEVAELRREVASARPAYTSRAGALSLSDMPAIKPADRFRLI